MKGTVYLIHFDTPHEHARHYLGWSENLPARLTAHANGRGSKLMAEIGRQGIGWRVSRTWPNETRHFERRLKRRKNSPRLCPACQA